MSYETFDHTADIGLRIRAPDEPQLLAEAGRALFSLVVANPAAIRPVERVEIRLPPAPPDERLFDWLSELLYLLETRHLLLGEFDVALDPQGRLAAIVRGEPIDRARHELEHEVKAITYHGLKVEQTGGHWLAEVIVDI